MLYQCYTCSSHSYNPNLTSVPSGPRQIGNYCLPCVLFARADINQHADPGALVSRPFVNFRRAIELFSEHAERRYHKEAILSMEAFEAVMSKVQPSIVR